MNTSCSNIPCKNFAVIGKKNNPGKFCSLRCFNEFKLKKRITRVCRWCNKDFVIRPCYVNTKFCCSRSCATKNQRRTKSFSNVKCLACGKDFDVRITESSYRKFCNQDCHNRYQVLHAKSKKSHGGYYTSSKTGQKERYDSSYELRRFIALDSSSLVKSWTRHHKFRIAYRVGRKKHWYYPDIYVEYINGVRFIEEVKGFVFDHMAFGAKNVAAVMFCNALGIRFRILFEEHLELVD